MNNITEIKKCPFLGWHAETLLNIKDNIFLVISTCKRYSGVSTSAQVWTITPTCRQTALFGDNQINFSMRHNVKRATEKAIKLAHEQALDDETLKAIITQHCGEPEKGAPKNQLAMNF